MLNWNDIIRFANKGTPAPDRRVEKTPEEWEELLTPPSRAFSASVMRADL